MSDALGRLTAALADRYAIERELGRGGMATVYLAHDLKHDRKVAVRVLHPELAAVLGAERFLNEIRVTANLQHPQILPLHDSGEVEGFVYYVMPYVEGESLRERLKREKELSVEETAEIAKAVASALDYAHRREVIHRDIKPENILLQDGQPVVADFGIALAVSAAGGLRLTETGLSVGTPQYMSPEQAMGDRELDGRSDIYSLGCVAYERLVGEPPYTGPTAQAIIAKVVTEEAKSVTATRKTVPMHVDLAILKALAKLPADRFGAASQLGDALADPRWVDVLPTSVLAARPGKAKRRDAALWASVGALATAAALVIVGLALWPRGPGGAARSGAVHRTSILLPDSAPLAFVGQDPNGAGRRSLALSPDGSTLVYVAHQGATTRLYRRRLDERRATPVSGTEGAYDVFFSPDGREVGFFVGVELKKIALEGGPPTSLATPEDPT